MLDVVCAHVTTNNRRMSDSPDNERERIRAWIETVLAHTGWTRHRLANEVGVSASTISDVFKPRKHTLSSPVIAKIERVTGILLPPRGDAPPGFAEPEAIYLAPEEVANDASACPRATGEQAVWRLTSDAIHLTGCMPGDLLLVDPSVPPRAGDVVCVQTYDTLHGTAETVFRVYNPPWAFARTAAWDGGPKPLLVDGDRVALWGTVVKVVRRRET